MLPKYSTYRYKNAWWESCRALDWPCVSVRGSTVDLDFPNPHRLSQEAVERMRQLILAHSPIGWRALGPHGCTVRVPREEVESLASQLFDLALAEVKGNAQAALDR